MTKDQLLALEQLNEFALTEAERTSILGIFAAMAPLETALQEIDTEHVDIMVHVHPLTNVLREDVRQQPFSREALLAGAPEHTDDSWQVPQLVK